MTHDRAHPDLPSASDVSEVPDGNGSTRREPRETGSPRMRPTPATVAARVGRRSFVLWGASRVVRWTSDPAGVTAVLPLGSRSARW